MGARAKRALARVAEALARFWPMSKTEEAVLDDLRGASVDDERPRRNPQSS